MSGAITAVFQVLCSPFSPLRRGGGANNDDRINESGGGDDSKVADSSESDGNDDGDDSTMVAGTAGVAAGNDNSTNNQKKRKRREKKSTTAWGTATREAKKAMTKRGELCQYFQTSLEKRTECGNKNCSCLKVLEDAHIRLLVAKYLVWFENK